MEVASHFSLLVYPFKHDISPGDRAARLQRLSARWMPWWHRLADKDLEAALDDTHFFLPYVRKLIFPETELLPSGDAQSQFAEARNLSAYPINELARRLYVDGVVRMTYNPARLAALHPLSLEFEHRNVDGEVLELFSAAAEIPWIDIALFPQSVGFLILKVNMCEQALDLTRLIDFLSYVRLIQPPRVGWDLAKWKHGQGDDALLFSSEDFADYLLQGLTAVQGAVDSSIREFVRRETGGQPAPRYSSTAEGQVYGGTFKEFTYVCLDGQSQTPAPVVEVGTPTHAEDPSRPKPLFESPLQQSLYELATCTQITQPGLVPHPHGLANILDKGYIALWANWQGLALHDNVAFLAGSKSGFTLVGLPHNVESDYFHLYMLTQYHNVRLNWISGEIMRHGSDLHKDLSEARKLWDSFIMFRNHYWFPEVTFRPQGIEIYHRYHEGLGVPRLYEHISKEMEDLQEYYESKAERRVATLINFLAFFGLPAELLVHAFAHVIIHEATLTDFLLVTLAAYAVAFLAWKLWQRFGKELA